MSGDALKRVEKLAEIRELRIEFALDHHVNTRGEQLLWDCYPHIWSVYECLSPKIVLMGSVQSLKSEWAIVDHLACSSVGLQVFYVLPKYESRKAFVQNRVDRCVANVPMYKKKMAGGSFSNEVLKNFGDGVIKYVGSNVRSDFREFPADVMFVDELDDCTSDNVIYGTDRMRNSAFRFERYLGNPSLPKYGIHAKFLASTQREWNVPCNQCGEFVEASWFDTVVEELLDADGVVYDYKLRDEAWELGCGRDIAMVCPHCGGELDRYSQNGRWVPGVPDAESEGFHISLLCSPVNEITDLWGTFREAIDDQTKLEHFYTSVLGVPFESVGTRVTAEMLRRITGDYHFVGDVYTGHIEGDECEGPCTMGVDVGGMFDVRISQLVNGRRKAVFIGKVRTLSELFDLADRYNVEIAVMDILPETRIAEEFRDGANCDVWLCDYGGEGTKQGWRRDGRSRRMTCDRTTVMDSAVASMKKRKVILPTNWDTIVRGEFKEEMIKPVRKLETESNGRAKFKWSKCKDHARHADVYDYLAARLMEEFSLSSISIG